MPTTNQYKRWQVDYQHLSSEAMNAILEAKNYPEVQARTSRSSITRSIRNVDKGLLYYRRCSDIELHCFLQDRRIALPDDHSDTRAKKIKLLEDADKDLVFPHFMALPVEIRCLIYEYSMSSIRDIERSKPPSQMPTTPALATVSRLVSLEVLGVFYKTMAFPLFVLHGRHDDVMNTDDAYPIIETQTVSFLRHMKAMRMKSIRHFTVLFSRYGKHGISQLGVQVLSIRVSGKTHQLVGDVRNLGYRPRTVVAGAPELDYSDEEVKQVLVQGCQILERRLVEFAPSTGLWIGGQPSAFLQFIMTQSLQLNLCLSLARNVALPLQLNIDIV